MFKLPAAFFSYARLMRLHQPTGIWLLLWPCWWSAALAAGGLPPLPILILLAIGAVVMRGAGCIVNDMADRDIDRRVERTRHRPLASGELSLGQAGCLLALLLVIALLVAVALGAKVVLWSALALPLVIAYPFMKRITWWPQLFLGITFNWGALVGWAAVRGTLEPPALWLYLGCIGWTLGYDTIYAHQDKADDAAIGVRSTALRLGERSKAWIGRFYALAVAGFLAAGLAAGAGPFFWAGLMLFALHLGRQVCTVDLNDPASCRQVFVSNSRAGWLPFLGLAGGALAQYTSL